MTQVPVEGSGPDHQASGKYVSAASVEELRARRIRVAVALGTFAVLFVIYSCRGGLTTIEHVPLIAFTEKQDSEPVMRLALKRKTANVSMAIRGPFRIFEPDGREIVNKNRKISHLYVNFNGQCIMLGKSPIRVKGRNVSRFTIRPLQMGTLELNGKVYPGAVEFVGNSGTRTLDCIIHMRLETYICGVLAGEVPADRWYPNALKAQAVTSRTYAMYYHLRNLGRSWDFGVTGMDAQQYKPGIIRNVKINKAVNETRGQVMTTSDNFVFPAYFHSSCGGHTLDSSRLFTKIKIRPLSGVPCRWCTDPKVGNKFSKWTKRFSLEHIKTRLRARGGPFNKLKSSHRIRDIEALERGPGGRIVRFRIRTSTAPSTHDHWANDVRLAIGSTSLPSTNCKLKHGGRGSQAYCVFTGSGWGHGVGLCQFGAQGMARIGTDYRTILLHYFPHSRIIRMTYESSDAGASFAPPKEREKEVAKG